MTDKQNSRDELRNDIRSFINPVQPDADLQRYSALQKLLSQFQRILVACSQERLVGQELLDIRATFVELMKKVNDVAHASHAAAKVSANAFPAGPTIFVRGNPGVVEGQTDEKSPHLKVKLYTGDVISVNTVSVKMYHLLTDSETAQFNRRKEFDQEIGRITTDNQTAQDFLNKHLHDKEAEGAIATAAAELCKFDTTIDWQEEIVRRVKTEMENKTTKIRELKAGYKTVTKKIANGTMTQEEGLAAVAYYAWKEVIAEVKESLFRERKSRDARHEDE